MQTLGQTCATALLLLTLSTSALAEGWIITDRKLVPPPPPSVEETKKASTNFDEIYESVLFLLKSACLSLR